MPIVVPKASGREIAEENPDRVSGKKNVVVAVRPVVIPRDPFYSKPSSCFAQIGTNVGVSLWTFGIR
jgi:hypothetical protein